MDGKLLEDYVGRDGDHEIGRIYLDQQTLKAGKWRWAIGAPKGVDIIMPNSGWLCTAEEAARHVEDCWDRIKAAVPQNSS